MSLGVHISQYEFQFEFLAKAFSFSINEDECRILPLVFDPNRTSGRVIVACVSPHYDVSASISELSFEKNLPIEFEKHLFKTERFYQKRFFRGQIG